MSVLPQHTSEMHPLSLSSVQGRIPQRVRACVRLHWLARWMRRVCVRSSCETIGFWRFNRRPSPRALCLSLPPQTLVVRFHTPLRLDLAPPSEKVAQSSGVVLRTPRSHAGSKRGRGHCRGEGERAASGGGNKQYFRTATPGC